MAETSFAGWSALLLGATLLPYAAMGATNLQLPGLNYDEAWDAVLAIDVLTGHAPACANAATVFGKTLPLMVHHHIGATSVYTSLLGFSLFGVSVETLRLTQLAIGLLALVLLFCMARAWFDDVTAATATLLCGSAPAFVWWSRAGINWTVPLLPLALGTVLALSIWWRTRRSGPLVAAAFMFGLGITTKILFVWLLAPLLGALLALGPREVLRAAGSLRVKQIAYAVLALLLGLLPFLVHNIPKAKTFTFIRENAIHTRYGHDNLAVLANLTQQARNFARVLNGDTAGLAEPIGWRAGALIVVACLIYTLVFCVVRRGDRHHGPRATPWEPDVAARFFLLLVPLTVIPVSTISVSGMGATYLFIIVPFVWLLVATVLADGMRQARGWTHRTRHERARAALAIAALVTLLLNHVRTNIDIHRFFLMTGGRGFWSDTVFSLARELETTYVGRPVVAMDWGFARSVEFLTHTRVRVREGFEFRIEPSAQFAETARTLLAEPDNVYLVHASHTTFFHGYWDVLADVARRSDYGLCLEKTLRERDGTPNTLIYTAARHPSGTSGIVDGPRCGE